ncbi:hypothetical protein [Streptomyces sp. NPDC087212]|uniref:hypothetical protein n=1 Tax=Streptomyces sp. NPDC087212 TaxID=3365766 RepID=UPI0037FC0175
MRRTARVLASAALAGAALGAAATAVSADPAAEVSPSTVAPGGNVTVTVTCPAAPGPVPATIEATSEAFDEGTIRLQRSPGGADDRLPGKGGRPPEGGGHLPGQGERPPEGGGRLPGQGERPGGDGGRVPGAGERPGGGVVYRGSGRISAAGEFEGRGPDAVTRDSAWTVDGTCPGGAGGPGGPGRPGHGDAAGRAWSATFSVERGGEWGGGRPCPEPRGEPCGVPPVQQGVHAGEGGTFTDSVPALVAGGVLIAGALGAAAHRLRHRGNAADG